MKTFLDITVQCNGQCKNIRIQTKKLRKYSETKKYGIYIPKDKITISTYQIDLYLCLTYRVELCGTCGKPGKQKRYTLHKHDYEVYMVTYTGMLSHVLSNVAKIHIALVEEDVIEDGVVILENQR